MLVPMCVSSAMCAVWASRMTDCYQTVLCKLRVMICRMQAVLTRTFVSIARLHRTFRRLP